VQKASITRYSAVIGYSVPQYSAVITATNNLSVFAASYYHKVNSEVEAEVLAQRKSFSVYVTERRLIRSRANERSSRFFQGSNAPLSGSESSSSLNKLFDKYRGRLETST